MASGPTIGAANSALTQPRSIVLIGKKGAGKSTIANSLSNTSKFPVGCILSRKKSWTWNDTATTPDGIPLTFYMLENIPPQLSQKYTLKFNDPLEEGISFPDNLKVWLVIFVFKYGCFTQEEKDFFESIMACSNDELKSISALVITGCDDLSEEAKETYTQGFKEDVQTKDIASFMQKGIHCVSLPDISKVRAELVQVYQEDIEQSKAALKNLLDLSSEPHTLDTLIKEQVLNEPDIDAVLKFVKYLKTKAKSCNIL